MEQFNTSKFNTSKKVLDELKKNKKYCEYCGHTMSFYSFEKDKKLCSYCGRYNYRDDKAKFKDLLLKKRREEKCQ